MRLEFSNFPGKKKKVRNWSFSVMPSGKESAMFEVEEGASAEAFSAQQRGLFFFSHFSAVAPGARPAPGA
jgi:hypothetical protein